MSKSRREHDEIMARAIVLDALAQALNDPAILAGSPMESPFAEAVIPGAQALGSAACRRALFALGELPPWDAETLRQRFHRALARPGSRPIPLYESLALSGRLMSPVTQDVARFYRTHGLEPDDELADSASVELAFLSFLIEAEAEALVLERESDVRRLRREQRRFLNEHVLAWLPGVGRALRASGEPHFIMLGHLLEDFLKEEQLRVLIKRKGQAQTALPFIADPAQCGLCGFCVQTCPTGALWVSENDVMTHLLLSPERCIGCGKCLPVCPDDALQMVSRPEDAAPTVSLRESPRARCPRCGAATVSQAELDAVFARLDADAQLRFRLRLCEVCKGAG